jgi:hypothetical protein
LKPRQPAGTFLSPTGLRNTPMRRLDTHPDAPYDEQRRIEQERVREASSIRDEPEVITDKAILRDWEQVARLHQSQQHALDVANMQTIRPTLPPEKRLEDIQRRAKHAHVNLSSEVRVMDDQIRRARTGNRNPPGRVLRRLETIEALLDGLA